MKGKLGILLFISLFLGFVLVGVGIGMIFPSIFRISAPLVCNGQMAIETREYSYRPGEYSTQHTVYCINGTTSEKRPITFLTFVVSRLIFSAIIFLLFCMNMLIKRLKGKQSEEPISAGTIPISPQNNMLSVKARLSGEDSAETLKKLQEFRNANLITEQEYEAKKAEILSRL